MKHTLRCLGPSLDHCDFNAWVYGDYFITLHGAIGETYIRLIQNRNDPAFYKVHANWCCGNDSRDTPLYMLLSFYTFIDAVDKGCVDKLPYDSNESPVWRDPYFRGWLLQHCFELTRQDSKIIYQEIRNSDPTVLERPY